MRANLRYVPKSKTTFAELDLIDPRHARYHVEPTGWQVRATCACGWRSRPVTTGGMAGSLWDQHIADVDLYALN